MPSSRVSLRCGEWKIRDLCCAGSSWTHADFPNFHDLDTNATSAAAAVAAAAALPHAGFLCQTPCGGVGSSDQTPIEPTARVWLELTEMGTDSDVHFESVS